MDTQTQIDRLIELAIIQRSELKQLVEQLPQLREHLNSEVEKVFDETEPQLRAELEEWTTKQTADKTAALGVALEAKIADLAKSLEVSTQARYNAIIAEREENARLAAQAEAKIAEHAASLPGAVKEIVSAELARFPRAGEIEQLRKEFAEPRGLNPRGKWQAGETYNKLDFVTINGDSYTSNIDNNRTRPSRSSADWTLVAARGTGGGGGPTSLSELTTVPSDGDVLIGSGTSWVTSNLTAGAGISITVGPGAITISATDGDITLDDGTAASPSLHFTSDPDTGIYRPAANTLGISVSGTQVAYFDENGLTVPSAGVVAGGSFHGANGNANNPSYSFSGDQDTGFFRHQPNEIGIALGGTQYATLTSTTFSITPVVTMASSLRVNSTTDSSSKDTGAIITEGGLGVEKSATFGGNLTVSGTGTSSVAGSLLVSGGSVANLIGLRSTSTSGYAESAFYDAANNKVGAIGFGNSATAAPYTNAVYINSLYNTVPIVFAPNGTAALTLSGTGNTTLAGNLTVSGTGASSVAGNLLVGTTENATQRLKVAGTGVFTTATYVTGSSGSGLSIQMGATSGNTYSALQALQSGGTNVGPLVMNPSGGNFLVGTTTDSGNGKIQLVTHTTSAGGIGFGTADSFYTAGVGDFRLKTTSAEAAVTLLSGGAYIGSVTAGKSTFIVSGSGSTALTLDSSQNATFAGTVTASKAGTAFYSIESTVNGALSEVIVKGKNSTGTAREARLGLNKYADDVFSIYDGTTERFRLGLTNGNATITGALAINNTVQTAVSVASTHKVTISIGGTTYYLLATNV